MTEVNDGITLPHLQGEGAAVRQVIAAYAIRGLRHIIEIGGAGLPITRYLQHVPRSVMVIDPKITPFESDTLAGQPCAVRHLARKFQAGTIEAPTDGLAVIMLGLSLKPFGESPAVTRDLIELCRKAERVVLEHYIALERSLPQIRQLMSEARLETVFSVDLVVRDGVMEKSELAERRLMVLKPAT